METVERNTHLGGELECSIEFVLSSLDGIRFLVPGKDLRPYAEGIRTRTAEGMPIGNREAKMLLHCLFAYKLLLVVELECKGIIRFRPLIRDLSDARKVLPVSRKILFHTILRMYVISFIKP